MPSTSPRDASWPSSARSLPASSTGDVLLSLTASVFVHRYRSIVHALARVAEPCGGLSEPGSARGLHRGETVLRRTGGCGATRQRLSWVPVLSGGTPRGDRG